MAIDQSTSMDQAPMTINSYLVQAIRYIDAQFGEGFSRQHPELLGLFIQACASDYLASRLEEGLEQINNSLRK